MRYDNLDLPLENKIHDVFCLLISCEQLFVSPRMTTASRLNLFRNFRGYYEKHFRNLSQHTYLFC